MEMLKTTSEVVEALGGYLAVAEITGSKPKAVSNWPRFDTFPARTYVALTSALLAKGQTAPAKLWGMQAAHSEEERAT